MSIKHSTSSDSLSSDDQIEDQTPTFHRKRALSEIVSDSLNMDENLNYEYIHSRRRICRKLEDNRRFFLNLFTHQQAKPCQVFNKINEYEESIRDGLSLFMSDMALPTDAVDSTALTNFDVSDLQDFLQTSSSDFWNSLFDMEQETV
jgi:hypothetical protein